MRRMIPQKLINAIKALLPFSNKVKYVGDQVKINADVEVEGLTSKGIANTGALANIGDGSFTGALTGKTIEQSEANYSAVIAAFPTITGGVSSAIFCRVQQLNKSLHIIFVGSITNNGESPISFYSTSEVVITLPEGIADKLYDLNGDKVSESSPSEAVISGTMAWASKDKTRSMTNYLNNMIMFITNKATANRIGISFGRTSNTTINAGESIYFDGRVELDLI